MGAEELLIKKKEEKKEGKKPQVENPIEPKCVQIFSLPLVGPVRVASIERLYQRQHIKSSVYRWCSTR